MILVKKDRMDSKDLKEKSYAKTFDLYLSEGTTLLADINILSLFCLYQGKTGPKGAPGGPGPKGDPVSAYMQIYTCVTQFYQHEGHIR